MTPSVALKIETIRAWTLDEVARRSIEGHDIWSAAWQFMKYIIHLPVDDLRYISHHASFFGGMSPMQYFGRVDDPEVSMEATVYRNLTRNIPEKWRLSEPRVDDILFQRGLPIDGALVNLETVRYQQVVTNLYLCGILDGLEKNERPIVCEIGCGYGPLALHLGKTLKNGCCILIDFPQTLFVAGVFLTLNHSESSIYLCRQGDSEKTIEEASRHYDYILVPHDLFRLCKQVNLSLVANVFSMQEMPEETIDAYFDFFSGFESYFYSDNLGRQPSNKQLSCRVEDVMARHYEVVPPVNLYEQSAMLAPYYMSATYASLTRVFLGSPKGKKMPLLHGTLRLAFGQVFCDIDKVRS